MHQCKGQNEKKEEKLGEKDSRGMPFKRGRVDLFTIDLRDAVRELLQQKVLQEEVAQEVMDSKGAKHTKWTILDNLRKPTKL